MATKKHVKKSVTSKKPTSRPKKPRTFQFVDSLTSLTFLGSMVRSLVVAAIYLGLVVTNEFINMATFETVAGFSATEAYASSYIFVSHLQALIVGVGAFLVIDALYVHLTKKFPLHARYDRLFLLGIELGYIAFVLVDWAILRASIVSGVIYDYAALDLVMYSVLFIIALAIPVRAFVGVTIDIAMKRRT